MRLSRETAMRVAEPITAMFQALAQRLPDSTGEEVIAAGFAAVALMYVKAAGRAEVERVFASLMGGSEAILIAGAALDEGASFVEVEPLDGPDPFEAPRGEPS